jgi:uncharacterized protein involved in outer membrane biogenesis
MNIKKLLKWTGITLGAVIAILLIWSIIVMTFGLKMDLSPFRAPVQVAASKALGRDVRIEGPVVLWPTAFPIIEVEGVRVANREGWAPEDLMRLERARLQLAVLPLLAGEISIGEITVEGLSLNLEATAEGENNWELVTIEPAAAPEVASDAPAEEVSQKAGITFVELERIDIRDISVNYRDGGLDRSFVFRLDELAGGIPEGRPMAIRFSGAYQEQPFTFALEGAPLADLADPGKPWDLRLSGDIVDVPLQIQGTVYAETEAPLAGLEVELGGVDIGAVLQWWEIVDGLELAVDQMGIRVEARGDNLYELLDESDFAFTLAGGEWVLRDPASGAGVPIRVEDGTIGAKAGEPLVMQVSGQLEQTPVQVEIQGDRLVAFAVPPEKLPISAIIDAAGARLELAAQVALPIDRKDADLGLRLSGERLDSLDELLDISLPPWGPYSLQGRLKLAEQTYSIEDFEVRVRDSDLAGQYKLTMKGERPRLDVSLRTQTLQINDFEVGDWSPEGDEGAEVEGAPEQTVASSEASVDGDDQPAFLLGPDVLGAFDAKVSVKVEQVLSGKDQLGSGNLVTAVENGRFTIEPLELNIPGGALTVNFAYEPTETDAAVEASAKIDQFDYGVLARRADPETEMGGILNLDLEIATRAEELEAIFDNASGHLGFGVWPERFEADVIELWAVNLMSALMPKLDDKPQSVVNCGIGWFDLNDGVLTEDRILIDTTKMQVRGEVEVNFKTEDVHMVMASYAKKAQFFALETPIEVSGKFTDFGVGAAPGGIFGTSVRFITSPVHVPLRRAFSEREPKDGIEACRLAWEGGPSEDGDGKSKETGKNDKHKEQSGSSEG